MFKKYFKYGVYYFTFEIKILLNITLELQIYQGNTWITNS